MSGFFRAVYLELTTACGVLVFGLLGCSANPAPTKTVAATPTPLVVATTPAPSSAAPAAPAPVVYPVMLGIDVLESQGFGAVKGKRVGLLTNPAGVNRRGESTIDVLRRAPGVKLVALYGPEHGIYGDEKAEVVIADRLDKRTGLPVYSLYAKDRKPRRGMLKGIDAMVVDLQDIGSRSYTYISAMKLTMEACFENNVEVIVLDRPNPLGGLKVDGPGLDKQWTSYVGAFRVPYVHGLTIAELARMAKEAPGVLDISESTRARGKLIIIPMRGWRRSMRWPDTGLTWVPTSPAIQDYASVEGYAMTGLGTYFDPARNFDIGFRHGIGTAYPFRGISHKSQKIDVVEKELRALNLPGLQFRRVSGIDRNGKPAVGLYVEINDFDEWRPTELSFYLMKIACKLDPKNPFLPAPGRDFSGFLRHLGSEDFFRALQRDGAKTDVAAYVTEWQRRTQIYQQQAKRFWLYY
jgi:uncharacterized protein YbbC (DUF1343 family)